MGTCYDSDISAWATEQAALLRAGKVSVVDRAGLADELDAIARSERRELARRMSVLTAQLVCWQYQVGKRCQAWRTVIQAQREAANIVLDDSPSLQQLKDDRRWLRLVWLDAVASVAYSLGQRLPDELAWPLDRILDPDFWPD